MSSTGFMAAMWLSCCNLGGVSHARQSLDRHAGMELTKYIHLYTFCAV